MRAIVFVGAIAILAADAASAQTTADPQAAALVSTDPIRCWWRSDTGAVTVGQSFSVTLTCAAIETDTIQVVPDESRFGVATIQVAPFEIVGGTHPSDTRRGSRRFFQYQYALRILDPDAIGHDVNVPSLQIQYRVRSRMNTASTLEGRDLTYVMPPLPIKVLSLVPAEAKDIRDGSDADFGVVDTLRFRASLFRIVGVALALVALVAGVWALGPWARLARSSSPESALRIPDRVVLGELTAKLTALKSESDRGWTDELVVRALSLLRIVSALAIDRPVNQRPASSGEAVDRRLLVSHGLVRPARATVASSMTTDDVTRAIAGLQDGAATRRGQLETLRDGLNALTEAAYRESGERDNPRLDDALQAGIAAARQLASDRTILKDWSSSIARSFHGKGSPS